MFSAMPINDITKSVEEQVLGYLTIAQEVVVDGVRRASEAVEPVLPDVPRPFAAEAADLVDGAFTFAEKLLHSGHQFATRLFEASDTSPDIKPAAAKPAASTSAAKASAK
jgi:hypothetical protein